MNKDPQLSLQSLKMLEFVMSAKDGCSGYDVMKKTNLSSGTLYPMLMRFENAGWLESEWADEEKPRRRLYRMTKAGKRKYSDVRIWK
jgi:PadR family transcriptional regulator, regulatory protein PadR